MFLSTTHTHKAVRRVCTLTMALILLMTAFSSAAWAESLQKESPMLAEMVAAGTLPPLEERLPENPFVAHQGSAEAVYGGQLRLAFNGATSPEYSWLSGALGRTLKQDTVGTIDELPYANVVEKYEINDSATEYTFYMRKGLKWSDGAPVTTEDVRFWWEDVILNTDITPSIPSIWRSPEGELMELVIQDEFTFSCKFADSYLMFPWTLSSDWRGEPIFFMPAHYLKGFHKDYADPAKLSADLKAQNYAEEDWGRYFEAFGWGPFTQDGPRNITVAKIGCPVLFPYYKSEQISPTVWIMQRNPYFFQVDEQGRQLPYIDTIRVEQVSETSMLTMKAMAGEVDYMREAMSAIDIPVLKGSEESGNYSVVPLVHISSIYITFNLGYEDDPGLADIFAIREFRQALNCAINRQEILSNLYLDQGKMPYHIPGDYDPDQANQLLDSIGMDKRDAEGFRLRPDGTPFTIDFQYAKYGTNFGEFVEIVRQSWAEVGIRILPKEVDRALFVEMRNANKNQVTVLWADPTAYGQNPAMWLTSVRGHMSANYYTFYDSMGKTGVTPAGDVNALYQLAFKLRKVTSIEDLNAVWNEITQLYYDSCLMLYAIEDVISPVIFSNRLGNTNTSSGYIESNKDLGYYYIKP